MRTSFGVVFAVLALLPLVQLASAGYGTSAITFTSIAFTMYPGATGTVGYNITIASGGTWGTTINIVNQAQLAADGINVSLSKASGDPPWSGTMTITTSQSTPQNTYSIILNATGDDPTTNNAKLTLHVATIVTSISSSTTTSSTTSTGSTTTAQTSSSSSTTAPYGGGGYGSGGSGNGSGSSTAMSNMALEALAAIIIIFIGSVAGMWKTKAPDARRIIIGVALILLGTVAWLFGDYGGGIMLYIWGGVAAIVVGTLLWLLADHNAKPRSLIWLGVLVLAVGTVLWLYADYYAGGDPMYVWTGVALILLGTAVWLAGDRKAHII